VDRERVEAAMAAMVALQERLQSMASTGWMKLDLTLPQVKVLMVLGASGQRMSEVGRALGASASTATGIVDRLTERGLVERVRDEADRRTVRAQLTRDGRETLAQIAALTNVRMRELLRRLSPEGLETVKRAMEVLLAAAER
jgi:DNA-binding MarR family transcriptional regulator